jgi:hypothetical protein
MTKQRPEIDDADVDIFVARFVTNLNPSLPAEKRADLIRDFVLGYVEMTEPEKSPEWAIEFAKRVRARALWL